MEIEAKLKLDAPTLAELAGRLGSPLRTVQQRDVYFQTAAVPVALRVRQDGERAWVTLKSGFEKRDGIRIREELEPSIQPEELPMWIALFERLGFPTGEIVEKTRREFLHGQVHVVLDDIQGLGTFAEVEVVGEDPTAAKQALEDAMANLGLAQLPRILESYRDLLRAAGAYG